MNNQTQKQNNVSAGGPDSDRAGGLSKKELYDLKKIEKGKQAQNVKVKKKAGKTFLWAAFFVVIVGGIFLWIRNAQKEAANTPGEFFAAQSRQHIRPGEEHPAYNTNPPTGGWHYDVPAQTGIYDKELPDEQLIHNLEHSHVWVSYHPRLDAETVEKLADIAKDFGSKIIMTPRQANDTLIVVAAWENLYKTDVFDEEAIRLFIKAHRGLAGPEKIPDSGFDDFREKSTPEPRGPIHNN